MSVETKRLTVILLSFFLGLTLLLVTWVELKKRYSPKKWKPVITKKNEECVQCHRRSSPALVAQWEQSSHAKVGVGCMECHQAQHGDPDAHVHKGALIATIVSPKDCGQCHKKEWKQFRQSHHAKAAEFIGSLDNVLGEFVEGRPAAASGCKQCHGSRVKVLKNGKLDPATWPNSGIGRINPDGSRGSCSACHSMHSFSKALARRPESCGRCHLGPDHPQMEIYNESKHGIAFHANIAKMNFDHPQWIVGKDYHAAPTCATCHMSRTITRPVTHDVGSRISWTLRPIVSKKLPNWRKRRDRMKSVCLSCHSSDWVDNFYKQYDAAVHHYNGKFARPALAIMNFLRKNKKLTPNPFDERIEWIFFELWHHEGRRARMGASMMGPDFTQWHGFYKVAKHFYFDFLPEAKRLGGAAIQPLIKKLLNSPLHRWKKGLSSKQRRQILNWYRQRYGQNLSPSLPSTPPRQKPTSRPSQHR